jgi:CubicO group peptidase (beta-lactamase class C family)
MGIVHDQKLIWSKGFGFSDLQSKKPATPETIYSICSISKLFTSIGVMQLYEQDKFQLDDPVDKLLPFYNIQETFSDTWPVTVRSLLSHSSGLPRESDYPYWTGPDFAFPDREKMMERLPKQRTLYPAERYFQYSNLALTLAGELIIEYSGQSFEDFVKAKILGPLELRNTTPYLPENKLGGQLATGYGTLTREGTRPRIRLFQARAIAPAAGFASNVKDLARFASWQFRLLGTGKEEILKASTLREMQRLQWIDPDWKAGTSRGLGFWVRRQDDKTFVGHGGSCPGYRTELRLEPKNKIAAIFMTNAMAMDPTPFTRKAHEIVGSAIIKSVESPGKGKSSKPELDQYVGLYRGDWGEFAVIPWEGQLAMVDLPTSDPLGGLSKIRQQSSNIFRRVRKDGSLGEMIRFDPGPDGGISRVWRHSNYDLKVR